MPENCWEFYKCEAKEKCPAYPKFGLVCFSIEGTLCRGEVQGEYVEKINECRACDFYKNIKEKE